MRFRRCVQLVVLLPLWLIGAVSAAHEQRVAVVVTGPADPSTQHLNQRVRAELLALGFKTVLLSRRQALDPTHMDAVAAETASDAVVVVSTQGDWIHGQVWLAAHSLEESQVRTVQPTPRGPDAPGVFSIRVAEVVRAVLLENHDPAVPSTGAPRPDGPASVDPTKSEPTKPLDKKPEPSPSRAAQPSPPRTLPDTVRSRAASLVLGGAVLGGPGGIPPAAGPTVAFLWWAFPRWAGEVRVIAPAVSNLDAQSGRVHFDQELAIAGVRTTLVAPTSSVVPFLGAGMGAHRLGVAGRARGNFESAAGDAWAAVLSTHVGAFSPITTGIGVQLDISGLWLAPRPIVHVAGHDDVGTGRPVLGCSLGMVVQL